MRAPGPFSNPPWMEEGAAITEAHFQL